MSMTYYTVDDLRPGRSGWGVKRFSALNDAISHYHDNKAIDEKHILLWEQIVRII